MQIRIDPHTLERAVERGASAEEIKDVIASGFFVSAKRGRLGQAKVSRGCCLYSIKSQPRWIVAHDHTRLYGVG